MNKRRRNARAKKMKKWTKPLAKWLKRQAERAKGPRWTPTPNPLRDGMTPEAEERQDDVVRRASDEDGEIRVYR